MVSGMADGEPRESGGEGIGVCPKHSVPWVLTPEMGELGVIVEGGAILSLVTGAHFWKAAGMWEGSIREKESLIFLFVCLEAEMSLRVMRPTSSDAKLTGGGLMWPCRPLHFA